MSFKEIRRGEIYYCNLGENKGSVQSGVRPVMVISANSSNNASTILMVAVVTSKQKKESKSHVKLGSECGLKNDSILMCEQITTIDIGSQLLEYVGKVTDKDKLNEIRNALSFAIGLPYPKKKIKRGIIMYLCPKCRQSYFEKGKYNLKSLDSFAEGLCDRCNNAFGDEYMLYRKDKMSTMRNN